MRRGKCEAKVQIYSSWHATNYSWHTYHPPTLHSALYSLRCTQYSAYLLDLITHLYLLTFTYSLLGVLLTTDSILRIHSLGFPY